MAFVNSMHTAETEGDKAQEMMVGGGLANDCMLLVHSIQAPVDRAA